MKCKILLFIIFIVLLTYFQTNAQTTNLGTGSGTGLDRNTFIGFQAGQMTNAPDNTFVGHLAGSFNGTGRDNSYFGSFSGYSSSGNHNAFFGKESGLLNTGSDNCFFGNGTGNHNTGLSNSFFGYQSGYQNLNGFSNAFVGYRSGYANTSGDNNTFLGTNAGAENTSGFRNTFVGSNAGNKNITGAFNTNLGWGAGLNSGGSSNTILGCNAGINKVSGDNNVFIGFAAGLNNTDGAGNVFIGRNAGYYETGSNKLYIANTGAMTPLIYGDFAAGNIGMGTNSVGVFRLAINGSALAMGGMWTSSDKRFKQNEKTISSALTKIRALEGVTYEFKNGDAFGDRRFDEGTQLGFIAQDLQKVLPELIKEDGDGYLAVNYQGVIPVLVEAVKELSLQVESLRAELNKNAENKQNNKLTLTETSLDQNYPNPSSQSTTIRYSLSNEVASAVIYVFNMQGNQVATFDQLRQGRGEINISAGELPPGLYHYTLVANGEIVDIKSMILTKD